MRIGVIGASGRIGAALATRLEREHDVHRITRNILDLRRPVRLYGYEVLYIAAANASLIGCETDPDAYRVNVDGPVEIARMASAGTRIVFLSSGAVETALHTAYGLHKAFAEAGLRAVCTPVIARICSRAEPADLPPLADWLAGLCTAAPGVYRWVKEKS